MASKTDIVAGAAAGLTAGSGLGYAYAGETGAVVGALTGAFLGGVGAVFQKTMSSPTPTQAPDPSSSFHITSPPSPASGSTPRRLQIACENGKIYELTIDLPEHASIAEIEAIRTLWSVALARLGTTYSKPGDTFELTLTDEKLVAKKTSESGAVVSEKKETSVTIDPNLRETLKPLQLLQSSKDDRGRNSAISCAVKECETLTKQNPRRYRPPALGIEPPKIPNEGNTCFLAAAIHAMHAAYPNIAQLANKAYELAPESSKEKRALSLLCNVLRNYDTAQKSGRPVENIRSLREALHLLNSEFKPDSMKQEDAADAMRLFLGIIADHLPEENNPLHIGLVEKKTLDTNSKAEIYDINDSKKNTSLQNGLVERVCSENPKASPLLAIRLLQGDKPLEKSIEEYFLNKTPDTEQLKIRDPGNPSSEIDPFKQKKEEKMFLYRITEEKTYLMTPPKTLILSLAAGDGTEAVKSNIPLTDLETSLVLKKEYFTDQPENNVEYELVGAVFHHGRTKDSGHYTAIVKKNGAYFSADDGSVSPPLSEKEFLERARKDGYQLIYRKK